MPQRAPRQRQRRLMLLPHMRLGCFAQAVARSAQPAQARVAGACGGIVVGACRSWGCFALILGADDMLGFRSLCLNREVGVGVGARVGAPLELSNSLVWDSSAEVMSEESGSMKVKDSEVLVGSDRSAA